MDHFACFSGDWVLSDKELDLLCLPHSLRDDIFHLPGTPESL